MLRFVPKDDGRANYPTECLAAGLSALQELAMCDTGCTQGIVSVETKSNIGADATAYLRSIGWTCENCNDPDSMPWEYSPK